MRLLEECKNVSRKNRRFISFIETRNGGRVSTGCREKETVLSLLSPLHHTAFLTHSFAIENARFLVDLSCIKAKNCKILHLLYSS